MTTLPLVSHTAPDSIIAWRANGAVTLTQFLTEVYQLAALLPAGNHVLNMCSDRYRFSVSLAAAIITGKISLLPPTHTAEVVRKITEFAPDVFCLTDSDQATIGIPSLRYPLMAASGSSDPAQKFVIPKIEGKQCIAIVFTSGSSGIPQPHPKNWAALVSSVQAEASRLGLLNPERPYTLIGTVPPQHMYGFESTVLMAWLSANAFSYAQPFYPADICQALATVPTPRVLVSSPVHLRVLLDADLALPEMALVVSATAPLSVQLAWDIEARCHAPLMEIYGSTETGLIATRSPTQTTEWQLLPGIKLITQADDILASGGHIESPTTMSDLIESVTDKHFLLHGRAADMINIAGKRHSLASLDHFLNTIPGVVDGAFFMPDESSDEHVTRLAACVVAPGMDALRLLALLRNHIDPVFLPRPLVFLEALPRNHTGKLTRAALQALFKTHSAQRSA